MKYIKLVILILIYPAFIAAAVFFDIWFWFRNLSWGEVSEVHHQWRLMVKEARRPGYAAWRYRRNTALNANVAFDEKEP